jgi:eukaryotic-like serine/threonine-protein kinase
MPLVIGNSLGPYQILTPLGAGGMGEVYKARDTKLNREVAVKILPPEFALDSDRVARFRREAQVLAALNHPNIAAIYGLEEIEGFGFLVLELVDGETLAQRIERGPVPVSEALTIGRQVADALEAAHERGIIHRDLKPANVGFTREGQVKVLDFGLAKSADQAPNVPSVTNSPTLSMMATQAGIILGTAAYMSPEQAKGLPADHRSDIFSFGCVLYELLTGRQAFQGDTAPDILASIVARESDFGALPPNLNPRLIELLKRCLEKQPKRRWQAIGDVRAELETIAAAPTVSQAATSAAPRARIRRVAAMSAVGVTCGLLGMFAALYFRSSLPPATTRLSIPIPAGERTVSTVRHWFAISRDGRQMAYLTNDRLYVRPLSQFDAKLVIGGESRQALQEPVFSPDGQSIVFYSGNDRMLKRIATGGGPAIGLSQTRQPAGITWDEHGILLGGSGEISRINPNGGPPEKVLELHDGEIALSPEMLPGGRAVLFTLLNNANTIDPTRGRVVVQSLGSNDRKVIAEGGTDARYVPTGHVVYAAGGALFAKSFDLQRLEASGTGTPVIEGVQRGFGNLGTGVAQYAVSQTGALIYAPGPVSASAQRRVFAIDRAGKATSLELPPGAYESPRFSPDGKRLALAIEDERQANVFVYELSGATSLRQLTFDQRNRFPIWSPDSQRIVFQSSREGDFGIWWQRADGLGVAERLTKAEKGTAHIPESFLPRTDTFSFSVVKSPDAVTLQTFSLSDRMVMPFGDVRSTAPLNSVFAPNGRWIAYTVRGEGGAFVYVQPVPPTGTKYVASAAGGHHPEWSQDGQRLLYFPAAEQLVSVPVTTQSGFSVGNPTPIPGGFISNTSTQSARNHDISPDGSRIVAVLQPGDTSGGTAQSRIEVVLNWFEELKQRVPVK